MSISLVYLRAKLHFFLYICIANAFFYVKMRKMWRGLWRMRSWFSGCRSLLPVIDILSRIVELRCHFDKMKMSVGI